MSTGKGAVATLTFIFIAAVAAFTILQAHPPDTVPASAPANQFSGARAYQQICQFAQKPHAIGSAQQALVKQYIVGRIAALGVQPQVEVTPVAIGARGSYPLDAGTVSDIIARLPGTAPTKPLVLMAHYDSVPEGPGAADDGEGVGVLLETLRALRASPPLRNDVIFLFTDGEEAGLLGAKAYVDRHRSDVGLVLNFEARGTHGPALMFETTPQNGWMIRQLVAAAPYPQANSLAYEAYRNMRNDTDLTIFKKAGIPGMNFAFIAGVADYHTELDNVHNLDPRSLQHQGSYALSLARRFGNLDLTHVKSADATYFNLPGAGMVVYPSAWSLPLALAAGGLLLVAIGAGFLRRRMQLRALLLAFFGFVGAVLASVVSVVALWLFVLLWKPSYRQFLHGDPYHPGIYWAACTALVAAVFAALYNLMRRRINLVSAWAGVLLVWLALAVVTAVYTPGVAYIFTWPLLAAAAGLLWLVVRGEDLRSPAAVAVLWACALPALLLLASTIGQLFVAMTMRLGAIPAFMVALLFGLLIPLVEMMSAPRRWWFASFALLGCAGCLVAGSLVSRYNLHNPKPDSLFYGLDADTGKATWFSGDARPDAWTEAALGHHPRRQAYIPFLPFLKWDFFVNTAKAVSLPPPVIERLQDETIAGVRSLLLHIRSQRHAPMISVYGDPHAQVLSAEVNGKPLGAHDLAPSDKPGLSILHFGRWSFNYGNPGPQGIWLLMKLKATATRLHFDVIDYSYDLAALPGAPKRPDNTIPIAWMAGSIFVHKSFVF
jgi:Peptidase family M28